jgi:kumamolisin
LTVLRTARRLIAGCTVLIATAAVSACGAASHTPARALGHPATTPLQSLLAASTDLGPSHASNVEALLTLPRSNRPNVLYRWASARRLQVSWQAPDEYALVHGSAAAMSAGFGVAIHDYRARSGTDFYATRADASVPAGLRGAVNGVGRMLSYVPKLTRAGLGIYSDVPNGGLTAAQLLRTYDATPLAQQGYTGAGATIVFFEIDGFQQSDLDTFSRDDGLRPVTPVLDTDQPGDPGLETPMDLEVAHAIVPDAKLVVFDARLQANSLAEAGQKIAEMYQTVDRKYPGAVWSISLGLRCESLFSAADLQPGQQALQTALSHGTSAFVSSGDTGSLECKGGNDYSSPPTQADVGLNAFSGLPAITVVGGTALSTDNSGNWIAEQAWTEPALQQGTSGGPSSRFARPSWQQASGMNNLKGNTFRMTPDVAADADPATGVRIFVQGQAQQGGGTSQAAPIWAGFAVMMNAYLAAHGGTKLGDINPLLYRAAASTPSAFHDVQLGGNSVDSAGAGYDYTTGLGTPDVAVLAGALLQAEKGRS